MKTLDANQQKLALVRTLTSLDGARVLDVGCGNGAATLLMAGHAASVVGVDPDGEAINAAIAATPVGDRERVSFCKGDVCDVALGRHAFDVIVFMRSL